MASDFEWAKLRYFQKKSPFDNWYNESLMNPDLLFRLDDFRHFIKTPIIVTSGAGGKHEKNSQHYIGNAVDIIAPHYHDSLFNLYLMSERFGFTGIGIYPNWVYKGEMKGGLHVDVRALEKEKDGTINYRGSRWMGVKEGGTQNYYPLTHSFLTKFNLVKE
jgi:hypothetical protein